MKEMVGGCCVCSDERGWPENPLVYCDGQGCTVAVHQACYGIVTVPTGPWYCRKCESQERSARVRCELCPSRDGALKRTDNGGWAHVVCALYIPEVRFGNVTTMEPIILQLIPSERFNKVCYICEELGKGSRAGIGACMQCNKAGCKQQFHVTCAQALGLLCEEAGNYLDNVKYCGYCQHHYSKLKKSGNVKPIPPYKPISSDNHSSDSSPEKDSEIISGTVKSSGVQSTTTSSSTSGKRKSGSSNSKTTAASKSSASSGGSKSSVSNSQNHQKGIHPSGNTPKLTVTAEKLPVSKTSQSAGANIKGSSTASKQNPIDTIEHSSVVITNIADHDKVIADKSNGRSTPSVKDPKLSGYLDTVITASDSAFGTDKSDSNLSSASSLAPKETKGGNKKRKVGGSRTPTPNSNISQSEADKGLSVNISSVVVPVSTQQPSIIGSTNTIGGTLQQSGNISAVHYDNLATGESGDKIKKMKTDHTASNVSSIPTVVPNSSSPSVTSTEPNLSLQSSSVTTNVIQPPTNSPIGSQNSLLVSVPLTNASLATAGNGVTNSLTNQTSVVTNTTSLYQQVTQQDRVVTSAMNIGNPSVSLEPLNHSLYVSSGVTTSDLNTGGLKISYEKQPGASGLTSANNMTRISDPSVSVNEQEVTGKRGRSQSIDKPEKGGRGKKRGSTGSTSNSAAAPQPPNQIPVANKRSSRSQHPTPPPVQGAFSSINQNPQQTVIKESPPSSPGSETTSVVSTSRKAKGRKSGGNIPNNSSTNSQDSKDIKVFQNGINAPHMLGNQLNPNSHMAQKMSDHLNSELEAHSIYTPDALPANSLVGPQLHSRVIASARSTSSNGSASNSTLGNTTNATPQTLDQLLERQWEQGSQFLMEQAQHFDIASLLSCLHQLRAENLRLEEHVNSLLQRRDHLLAVNARLAIPLTTQSQPVPATSQPHTVNNIHPAVSTQHVEMSSRSGGFPLQNGLPPEPLPSQQQQSQGFTPQQIQLRTTQPHSQPSPTIRHSQSSNTNYVPGVTSTSSQQQSSQQHGVVRANRSSSVPDTTRGNAPPHSTYGQYQSQGSVVTTQHQQMVIRRDSDLHHQMAMPGSSKPS